MNGEQLPVPKVADWQRLYEEGAKARCVKDDPPMHGFGRAIKAGEIVEVDSVCWRGSYEIGVRSECAFYKLEGYFEVEPTVTDYCASCAEGDPVNECPKSEKDCGHHCNHVWSHNGCCWCGYEEGEEEATDA